MERYASARALVDALQPDRPVFGIRPHAAGRAAQWFLKNYQADKNGARASDSLLYLAESMRQLKDTNRACIALAEFGETFAAEAAGRLKTQYEATRRGVKCS